MNTVTRFQRVKIVATLGPATADPAVVREMAAVAADGFRLNTAHMDPGQVAGRVEAVRRAEEAVGRPLAVLCDLAGPKLRVVRDTPETELPAGAEVTLGRPGTGADIAIEGFDPAAEVEAGARISLHDGLVRLTADGRDGAVLRARVTVGGTVAGGTGVNLPDAETSLPSLTDRDRAFVDAAVEAGVDAFALSFVRSADDVRALRRLLDRHSVLTPVVAKLEKSQAVRSDALRDILAVSDMVMVARGDLGAETSPEQVPVLQKQILVRARAAGVPTITATEMLLSMVSSRRPTRAEAADVANAVLDGSDALLLTAETAVGHHPVEAVRACAQIVGQAEIHPELRATWFGDEPHRGGVDVVADAVARGAVVAAEDLRAAAIVCFTTTGRTARLVARHRPDRPVLALTPDPAVARGLALVWGIEPRVSPAAPGEHEDVVRLAEAEALRHGVVAPGQLVVVTHGAPLGDRPATNVLRVHRVGGA